MDQQWIVETINAIASMGADESGAANRLAFTVADKEARSYVASIMESLGMTVRIDAIGNVIGRLEGTEPQLPPVAMGSHVDTVPHGGHYDGVVGVVGALAAVGRLKAKEPLRRTVEVVVFVAEESSRFSHSTMGSKAMTGSANLNAWERAVDSQGIAFPEALAAEGLSFENLRQCVVAEQTYQAYLELHIDQSKQLEERGAAVGVVEAIAAPTRFKMTVTGIAGHSGTTPMHDRYDALVSASELVLAIRNIANDHAEDDIVATVGNLKVYPGAMNVVPGKAELWVDLRGTDYEYIVESLQEIKDAALSIAEDYETPVTIEMLSADKPVSMDENLVALAEKAAEEVGVEWMRAVSGAGHDAMNMAKITPAGMIFVRSRDGVSHHPDEYAAPEDIEAGVQVLAAMLRRLLV
jgi:N-carbamoyl-L-amino-acid hydrolase